MEGIIATSALLIMPVYAFVFILSMIAVIRSIRKDESCTGSCLGAAISFALMMWTLSGSILLSAN